jgi:phosphatidylglycerophosphate synthase
LRRQAADSQLDPSCKVHAFDLRPQTALSICAQTARPMACRNRRHPNQVTLAAALISFLVGAFIALQAQAKWPLLLMPVALFLRMVLNAVDGMLAREHGMKSRLSVILNELGDVLSDAVL